MPAAAILPVKRFDAAKQRLSGDLPANLRALLAEAMVADVLAALSQAEEIVLTVVVSGAVEEPDVEHVVVVTDALDAGQSPAALAGMERAAALGYEAAVLVPGDCPLLDPAELDAALGRMAEGRVAVIPDRHGTGTNGLLLAPGDAIGPAFGPGSCARHLDRAKRAGHHAATEALPSLALDVDTPDDVAALGPLLANEPDRAPSTATALARLPIATDPAG